MSEIDEHILIILGDNIRKTREMCNINRNHFAELINYNRQDLANLEKGKHDVRFMTVYKIAKYFNVSIEKLFSREYDYQNSKVNGFIPTDYMLVFSKNVHDILKQKELLELSISMRTDIDQTTVSRIMTGKISNPRITTLNMIANCLSCSMEQILERK